MAEWVIGNLSNALKTWNEKLAEIWQIITQDPATFKGGLIWTVIVSINGALQAIGYALLVLFFVMGIMKQFGSFAEVKKPEHAIKLFIRFILTKAAITHGLELSRSLFSICQGIVNTIMVSSGLGGNMETVLPESIVQAIEGRNFVQLIPVYPVSLIVGLVVTVLSFVLIMSVYARFFRLYFYIAMSPIALATFAGEPTQGIGRSFLKGYVAVCLEAAIIILACVIFSAFAASPPVVDATASVNAQIWSYCGELIFNMLILVGAVKMSDRIVREMFGLH